MSIARDSKSEMLLSCLFLATTGGAFWAVVRMSGEGCGWTNGLMWGLAWRYLSVAYGGANRRPYGSGWTVLAMVAGMYLGGMHGYGQFHSWIQGTFHLESDADRITPISRFLGYWWNALCGLGWGGAAGVVMVWFGRTRPLRWWEWIIRILLAVGLAWGFRAFAEERPDLVMPLFDRINYLDSAACPDCARTTRTLVESMMWLGFCAGGIVFEASRRNWRNLGLIVVMGLGFAAAFTLFEWFHVLPNLKSTQIGWWKYWETSVGMIGGLVVGLCFVFFNQPRSASLLTAEDVQADTPHPRAEFLLGIALPLLVSFYKVLENEAPRLLRMVGGSPDRLGPAVLYGVLCVLVVLGLLAVYKSWRDAHFGMSRSHCAVLFLIPYVVLFLISYVPQLAKPKVWANWALPVQLGIYVLLFLAGLACFFRLHRKTRSADGTA